MRTKKRYEKRPTFARVLHKPNYCVLQSIDAETNRPFRGNSHSLSPFSARKEVQSKQSIKGMTNAINWMFLFSEKKNIYSKKPFINNKGELQHNFKFRLAFITLTMPGEQVHSDEYIKKHMLQPFLYWLTRYYTANYVWKAETQLNGNIHFHITIDTFVHWRSIRAKWNSICAKHNYCKFYQEEGTNDKGNAATQIKAIRNEDGIARIIGGYLTKGSIEEKEHQQLKKNREQKLQEIIEKGNYISCNIQNRMHYTRFVEGRVWGCTEALSNINCFLDESEGFYNLHSEEKTFFTHHGNKVKQLLQIMVNEKNKKQKMTIEEEFEFRQQHHALRSIYIHPNLLYCKLPPTLAGKISDLKKNHKQNLQTHFTVESLN